MIVQQCITWQRESAAVQFQGVLRSLSNGTDAETLLEPILSGCACRLNSVLDVTNGILYIAVSVPNPRKAQTTVVTVLQDATGVQLDPAPCAESASCASLSPAGFLAARVHDML